jgi:hypothetical protein
MQSLLPRQAPTMAQARDPGVTTWETAAPQTGSPPRVGSGVVAKPKSGTPDGLEVPDSSGGPSRTRTLDPLIKSLQGPARQFQHFRALSMFVAGYRALLGGMCRTGERSSRQHPLFSAHESAHDCKNTTPWIDTASTWGPAIKFMIGLEPLAVGFVGRRHGSTA